jgi:pre-mRNA branch site protein p14
MSIRPGKPTGPQVSPFPSGTNLQTILFVKNLAFKVTSEEMYDLFGRFGPIRQIRLFVPKSTRLTDRGNKNATRGTAYVVYESPQDAKVAIDKLNGFSFGGRFLVVLMHQLDKVVKPEDLVTRQEELERLKKQYNV